MLEKANEQIAGLKERMEFEGTDAGLRQQLNFEREKDTNRELKRELLVYEGVLPPYLETQGTSWINEKRMKWTRENRELRELRDAELQVSNHPTEGWGVPVNQLLRQLDALALTELSPSEKIEREITRLKEQNTKMNAYLEQNQIVHTMLNAPTPSHIVKLAEENMVLKAKWEKNWELTAAKREKQKNTEDDATRKEKELQSENFETWKERKDQEAQPQYQARQGRRWRKRDRDDDFELSDVECVMVTRRKMRLSSSS